MGLVIACHLDRREEVARDHQIFVPERVTIPPETPTKMRNNAKDMPNG